MRGVVGTVLLSWLLGHIGGAAAAAPATSPSAAVFQYSVPVATEKGASAAFLWVPAGAPRVRGVVIGGMTLAERELAKDPQVRAACAEQQLAIVFLKTGLASADVQKVLDDLAKVSGYRELTVAPLFVVGHSAGGPQAKALAIRWPQRTIAVVQYRGGVPGGAAAGDVVPPGVPALMMVGQFDEFGGMMRDEAGRERPWEVAREALGAYRARDGRNLASLVVEPGAGHFAWSDRNAAYLALYIRKAARARIPEWPVDAAGPVACKGVEAAGGWLTDPTIKVKGEFEPAAYAQYKGDPAAANWHFDEELARATVAYHAGFGKKDQFIKWADPYWVDAGTRYFFTSIKWVGDGQTFEVHPVYAETYPATLKGDDGKPRGPRWHRAGEAVGHSSGPILIKRVSGPVVAVGPSTFRMQFDGVAGADEAGRVTFMAYSAGDAEHRYTEHVGMMPRGFAGIKAGKEQSITFPEMGDIKADAAPVELKATSDAGLPVEYYVAHGPAEIVDGNKLKLVEVPARAAYPIEVKVVACQFGRGLAPLVKTAAPVERTVRVAKP